MLVKLKPGPALNHSMIMPAFSDLLALISLRRGWNTVMMNIIWRETNWSRRELKCTSFLFFILKIFLWKSSKLHNQSDLFAGAFCQLILLLFWQLHHCANVKSELPTEPWVWYNSNLIWNFFQASVLPFYLCVCVYIGSSSLFLL